MQITNYITNYANVKLWAFISINCCHIFYDSYKCRRKAAIKSYLLTLHLVQTTSQMSTLTIADQIRALRKSKGLSQETLADIAGINLRTLQRIESGNVEPRGET